MDHDYAVSQSALPFSAAPAELVFVRISIHISSPAGGRYGGWGAERFLDNVQGRLVMVDRFMNIGVPREMGAAEKMFPASGFQLLAFKNGQLVALSQCQPLHQEESRNRENVQKMTIYAVW